MIKLVALDMDGTVLNSKVQIDDVTKKAIQEALQKGVIVVPTTGRVLKYVPADVVHLKGIRYVISSSGAKVMDMKKLEPVYDDHIPEEKLVKLLEIFNANDIMIEAYIDGVSYLSRSGFERLEEYVKPEYYELFRTSCMILTDKEFNYLLANRPVEKINFYFYKSDAEDDPEKLEKVFAECKKLGGLDLVLQAEGNGEVTNIDSNKGEALAALTNSLGIDCGEVMAVGDSNNDISMLTFAEHSVSMGNALKNVHQYTKYKTDTNDNYGVAKAIDRLVLNPEKYPDSFPTNEELFQDLNINAKAAKPKEKRILYCYPKCSTCKKAEKFLKDHNITYEYRDIAKNPPDKDQLLTLYKRSELPRKRFFNTSGLKYRELGLKDTADDMTAAKQAALQASDGMLIKRPLFILPKTILLGFKQSEWEEALGIQNENADKE